MVAPVDNSKSTYTIQQGDSPWKVAQKSLQIRGASLKGDAIIREMNRLAQINDCNSVDDFTKKYFFSTGKKLKLDNTLTTSDKPVNVSESSDTVSTHVVQQGDSPWKVARENLLSRGDSINGDSIYREMQRLAELNGCDSIDSFAKTYFGTPGKELKLDSTLSNVKSEKKVTIPKEEVKPKTTNTTIKENWTKTQAFYDEINGMESDKEKVLNWHKKYPADGNFVIVDKKSCTATFYSPDGEEVTSFMVGLGDEKGDDYLTAERRMTSAGIYTVNYKGSGRDDYARLYNDNIFQMTTDRGETGVALHQIPNGNKARQGLNYDGNLENNRYSNGCVNFEQKDFEKLKGYIGVGSKVYILPEDPNNYLVAKNGQLNLTQKEYTGQVKTSTKNRTYVPINEVVVPADAVQTAKDFGNALKDNKESLMKDLALSSDEYNDIALVAMGIAQQESDFGDSQKYKLKEYGQWAINVLKWVKGNNSYNSRGLTQMKLESYTDPVTKNLLYKYNITSDDLDNPEKSAIATMIVLGGMYKNELNSAKVKQNMKELNIKPMDALLYVWNGRTYELTRGTATPDKNIYVQNVRKYASQFDFTQSYSLS